MAALTLISLFGGCAAKNCTGSVTYLSYSKIGSWMDGYSVTVKTDENGDTVLIYTDDRHRDYGEMTVLADASLTEAITKICNEHEIRKWNGFDKSNKNVMDGDGFSLSAEYEGGGRIHASGYMKWPKGYSEFVKDLMELCAPYTEKAMENALQAKIDAGVQGDCVLFMGNFIQNGTSGQDSYRILISRSDVRTPSFDIEIRSVSGEFFPEGEYRYCLTLPDVEPDLSVIRDLVNDLGITQWMDWDRTAEDYNNEEWFQIDITFEEGAVEACGSLHPEHYEEFRTAVLTWLKDTVDKIEDLQ